MIPEKAKLILYKSVIILANLIYCHTVWHFCKASDARKLERIQERANYKLSIIIKVTLTKSF